MTQQVLEGTWEEIVRHADELAGRHVRVTILPESSQVVPNEGMLAALRELEAIQEDMRKTPGDDTQRMLRRARAGGMYGLEPSEE